jgi:hypothetical protein
MLCAERHLFSERPVNMGATSKFRSRKNQNHRAKRQKNGRIKSRTVNMRTHRATAQRAEQIPQGGIRKIQSPSIIPEIQQTEVVERYMVNEVEFIRTFGWWGLH